MPWGLETALKKSRREDDEKESNYRKSPSTRRSIQGKLMN